MVKALRAFFFIPMLSVATAYSARDYRFDGKMIPEVLNCYLSRSITEMDLLIQKGDLLRDNLRMLRSIGAKFAGRTIYLWGHEAELPSKLSQGRNNAIEVHKTDPEIILQGCVFEIVSREVERMAIPHWAFEALGLPVEHRNFRYEDMIYADGRRRDQWYKDASVPDMSRPETKLWFYYVAVSYIDVGCEAIHFGQVELMNTNDPQLENWWQVLSLVRQYASSHARRHFVLCDAHVPTGGYLYKGRLLFDFHAFPLRVAEVSQPHLAGVLCMGFTDAIYGRSKGGITPSGWRCEHLPYLVELDNWGVSDRKGDFGAGGIWVWGYDEISWFAHQDPEYRNQWLHYAWNWVREHDTAGFVEMPGSRCVAAPVDGKPWYYANTPSAACPGGFGQEETIREIWSMDK